jgi:uncharacterized protein YegJ (DUF2314 family)
MKMGQNNVEKITAVPLDAHPDILAAILTARSLFGWFLTAFVTRTPTQAFKVAAAFHHRDGNEVMWVNVTGLGDGVVFGQLEDTPHFVVGMKKGGRVTVAADQIIDWAICDGHSKVGNFVDKLVKMIHRDNPSLRTRG